MGRLRDWWDRVSPRARWERRVRQRRERLDALSLTHADRAAALVLHGTPVLPLEDASNDGEMHPYTDAFLRRHDATICGDEDFAVTLARDSPAAPSIADRIVVAVEAERGGDHALVWTSRPGEIRVDIGTTDALASFSASLPSVAHAVLETSLDDDEVHALSRDPAHWAPAPGRHPSRRSPRAPEHLVLDDRSRAWALVGSLVVLAIFVPLTAVAIARLFSRFECSALCPLGPLVPLCVWNARRLVEVVWLEPRARRLRLDDEGLRHPITSARVTWRECRALEAGPWNVALTLPDGLRVRLSRSVFREPEAALAFLAARIGRGGPGPFRRPP